MWRLQAKRKRAAADDVPADVYADLLDGDGGVVATGNDDAPPVSVDDLLPRASKRERQLVDMQRRMETPLDASNKGFQLLSKMGFKAGQGLGKNESGRIEPVAVTMRFCRTGVGAETDVERTLRVRRERAAAMRATLVKRHESLAQLGAAYTTAMRRKFVVRKAEQQLERARALVEELDGRVHESSMSFMWPGASDDPTAAAMVAPTAAVVAAPASSSTAPVGRGSGEAAAAAVGDGAGAAVTATAATTTAADVGPSGAAAASITTGGDGDGDGADTDAPSEVDDVAAVRREWFDAALLRDDGSGSGRVPCEVQLELAIVYLRSRHLYCMFCGNAFESAEDMDASCPGLFDDDH